MKKNSKYMTRALKSRDPRFANILDKLGYERTDMISESSAIEKVQNPTQEENIKQNQTSQAPEEKQQDEMKELRSKYENIFGKRPFYGWDKETLLDKIEKAKT